MERSEGSLSSQLNSGPHVGAGPEEASCQEEGAFAAAASSAHLGRRRCSCCLQGTGSQEAACEPRTVPGAGLPPASYQDAFIMKKQHFVLSQRWLFIYTGVRVRACALVFCDWCLL